MTFRLHASFLLVSGYINYFCYGILEDCRLSGNFPECCVSIRHSGRFMRTANPWFPMSSSTGLIVMECRYWKILEAELCNYSFKLAQLEKINILPEKRCEKKQLWKIWGSKHVNFLHHKVGKDTAMEIFLYLSLAYSTHFPRIKAWCFYLSLNQCETLRKRSRMLNSQ